MKRNSWKDPCIGYRLVWKGIFTKKPDQVYYCGNSHCKGHDHEVNKLMDCSMIRLEPGPNVGGDKIILVLMVLVICYFLYKVLG